MTPTKQRITIASIVVIGIVIAVTVLHVDRRSPGHGTVAPYRPATVKTEDAHASDQVKLDDAQIAASGIALAIVTPGTVDVAVPFQGEIRLDEDRTAHVVPRAAGVVERVDVKLGQVVRAGQLLAVISSTALAEQRSEWLTATKRRELARTTWQREKQLWEERISAQQDYLQAESALQEADIAVRNASEKLAAVGAPRAGPLNRFEIRAPLAGTIVEKHVTLGESVKEDTAIFTIADLASVSAEFAVPAGDLATVRVGAKASVSSSASEGAVDGTVSYVGAVLGERTRTAKARVTVANADGAWRPGLFVTVAVMAGGRHDALVVRSDAIQIVADRPTVFVRIADGFDARAVKPGHSDRTHTEVLEGLQAGESYAASSTFVLKSELGKAGAEHGH